ncbi:nucleoside deaminase [Paracidovorax konjaci]|uniref:nucleoside deaminase n=1 Tax=Paracidovorax konjaci TaxID=32040 RepID=UPI000A76F8FF|nr:nucleoside deaminase [Paracidovorax konjaci]
MTLTECRKSLAQRMQETVAYSIAHVHDGGIPFSAFVINAHGHVIGRGVNRVRERRDPTAHAEVEAIRDACRHLGMPQLHGMTLLASGEPCALCYMSARYAGITRMLFAVDRHEAAAHGFDYRSNYALLAGDPLIWHGLQAEKLTVPDSLEPFLAFRTGPRAR